MKITIIHAHLTGFWGASILKKQEIVKETEKCYFAVDVSGNKMRYLKEDIGIPIIRYPSYRPYLEYILVDGTKQQLRDGLAKWFNERAKTVKNGKFETDYNNKD